MAEETEDVSSANLSFDEARASTPNVPEKEKAKNFLSYLFSREEPPAEGITLSQQDQKEIQKSVTQLEAGLGKAGRACVLSFQRWGQDFWNMPEAEIFDGLVKSFWNQILIVVSDRKKRIMELKSLPQAKMNAVNFPPLEEEMVNNFTNFQENPDSTARDFIRNNCYDQTDLCFRSLKRERGYFSSIANTIRSAKDGHNPKDWKDMIQQALIGDQNSKGMNMKIPTRLKSLVLLFLNDPNVVNWSNMINGLVLFKFYSLYRNDNDVKDAWRTIKVARDNLNRNLDDYLVSLENTNIPENYEYNGKYSNVFINLMNAFTRTGKDALDWFRSLGGAEYYNFRQKSPAEVLSIASEEEYPPISDEQNNNVNNIIGLGDVQSDEILDTDKPRKKKASSKKKTKNVEESLSEEVSRACPIDIPGRGEPIDFGGQLGLLPKVFEELGQQFLKSYAQLSSDDDQNVINAISNIQNFLEKEPQLSELVDVLCDIKYMVDENLPQFKERYNKLFNPLPSDVMDEGQNDVEYFQPESEEPPQPAPTGQAPVSEQRLISINPVTQNQQNRNVNFLNNQLQKDQQLQKEIELAEERARKEAEKQSNEPANASETAPKKLKVNPQSDKEELAPPLVQAPKPPKQATRVSQRKSIRNTQLRDYITEDQ